MELLAPRLFGPLSECSRSAAFENAIPGATVILVRIRAGVPQDVGQVVTTFSHGVVTLDPGQEFIAGDQASTYQVTNTGSSPLQPDAITVQNSDDQFNPPQVLSHLYACSRGFAVGAMRPGTKVEILDGGSVIASGEAANGAANLRVLNEFGLPMAGAVLTVRQRVCPKPPPPGGAPEWVIDSLLPPVEPLPSREPPGGTLPAPKIVSGLTDCSRSVVVSRVIPGAEVIIEDTGGAWWASRGPSDATSLTIELPVPLSEGREVEVRQEVGRRCEMQVERRPAAVGPYAPLARPQLATIECHSSPTVHVLDLKVGADIEFEVTFQGQTKLYRTVATQASGPLPAPPMPAGAFVRLRQGECGNWSDWSDPPQLAKELARPVQEPRIVGNLFQCQNSVTVENIDPLSGTLRVISSVYGEIAKTSSFANVDTIKVAPSLVLDHDIFVEHEVCGLKVSSQSKRVQALVHPGIGQVVGPLYDGDTSVTVEEVTTGAYLELWDQNQLLQTGMAPSSERDKVSVSFSNFGALRVGQHIYVKFWHCGHYGRNEGLPVQLRKPELHAVQPSSVAAGGGDLTIAAQGLHFRPGAQIWFQLAGFRPTTFISTTELRAQIPGHIVANQGTRQVQVWNPDNQVSGIKELTIVAPPPPPPPANLQLSVMNQSGGNFAIVGVVWTIWRQQLGAFDPPTTLSGASVTFQPVANGQYHIHADVNARREATGDEELAEFRGTATGPGGAATLVIVWSGTAATRTFRLIAEGQGNGLFNPVVILQ